MSPRARQLASRREELIARSEVQRAQLAETVQPLKSGARIADQALRVAGMLRRHPFLTALGIATVMIGSRGRLLRWVAAALPLVGSAIRVGRALRRG
jgi:YqjK-like protein